ncbi:hypothetical protein AB0J86_28265 [Micromonospora sp. NPDC049559]|uniref:hypothetical protein n=1 Tax=Micromonospora sp. NPDC049559 TaxID=3155923 RepID=UPI00343B4547
MPVAAPRPPSRAPLPATGTVRRGYGSGRRHDRARRPLRRDRRPLGHDRARRALGRRYARRLLGSGLASALLALAMLAGAPAQSAERGPDRPRLAAADVGLAAADPELATEPESPASPEPELTPDVPDPTGPTGDPSPTGPPPVTTAPATGAPPNRTPPTRGRPGALGVAVTTGDIVLDGDYWRAPSTTAQLAVTVTNTGDGNQLVQLGYTLPAGLADAGTPGCAATGDREYRCGSWPVLAGARFETRLRVRVDGDAWRAMPLSGSLRVTARDPVHPERGTATEREGFAVLFPPGPPTAGVTLSASEVNFDITGQPAGLDVRLGNTGDAAATGAVEVVLPAGVTVVEPPTGCRTGPADRTRCELGMVAAGASSPLRLTLAADAETQLAAPFSGAVVGTLTIGTGASRQVRTSFRILAASAGDIVPVVAPTGSEGVLPPAAGGLAPGPAPAVDRTAAIGLIAASLLLIVLALALAVSAARGRVPAIARRWLPMAVRRRLALWRASGRAALPWR